MFQRAFSVSTREPAARLFDPGGHSPTRGFVVCATLEHMFRSIPPALFRQCFGVSCGIARARSFVCDHGRARRVLDVASAVAVPVPVRHVVAVAVVTSQAVPVVALDVAPVVAVVCGGRPVFVSPSCGCDTPMDASVCNGFSGVCVVSICLTFARRV